MVSHGRGSKKGKAIDVSTPTHKGLMRNHMHPKGAALVVRLVENEHHWVTCPGRLFFRKSDGLPRGRTTCVTWALDLDTIQPIAETKPCGGSSD